MFSRSSLLHLRITFSYFLLPIFLFSASLSPNFIGDRLFWVFFILHFLLYPASNAYNSYFDKDEGSIGGLENPPPVEKGLYYLALLLDLIAIALGWIMINATFSTMLLIYGLVSKAYSHPSVRLKKYPVTGWIITGLFQGLFTVMMCYVGINDFSFEQAINLKVITAGSLAALMLWANYPMTQVYQHEEDARRGDRTFSLMLGVKGTFYFTGLVFVFVTAGFFLYFNSYYNPKYAWLFVIALSPVIVYFSYWFLKVLKNESVANYRHTMWLNLISATCLNIFFLYLFFDSTQLLQLFQG